MTQAIELSNISVPDAITEARQSLEELMPSVLRVLEKIRLSSSVFNRRLSLVYEAVDNVDRDATDAVACGVIRHVGVTDLENECRALGLLFEEASLCSDEHFGELLAEFRARDSRGEPGGRAKYVHGAQS